ncbi:MAG: glycerol-3-phosphate 1-O-acyltransferase PlsY [Roseburia sp.]|nr:glycerol-3-phosphate 1-O-acyltransferase PlsY [Anaeroplasma bactoclasticum]MCM1196940.1 glycerol-3-phosphate 1-O-acyltransferase PlsY [Roseburia sp.]
MQALDIVISILFLILAYLIGSIPFGVLLGKLICKKDIREYGSKNIGTTNAIRVLGKKVGFLVFFFDVLKGPFILIILKILEVTNCWVNPSQIDPFFYGAAAILGHSFSIFLNFKGGKAVATSLGVVLFLTPIPAIACLFVFAGIFFTTKYVSLASTGATFTVIITAWLLYAFGVQNVTNFGLYFIAKPSLILVILYTLLAMMILIKHIKNYKRLLNGTENSFRKEQK